jgi:hypothetical protein
MTETAQRKRGGKPFHSILEPHFDFIREQRQRRKTWQEIADLLFSEKGIRVTFYAPYRFYRRKLKRAPNRIGKMRKIIPNSNPPAQRSGQPAAITPIAVAETKPFQPSKHQKH